MKGIVETLQAGEQPTDGQMREIIGMVAEWMETDLYKILSALNINEIKRLASTKVSEDNPWYILGLIQGIQDGLENRLKAIISNMKIELDNKKAERKFKKESLEEEGEPQVEMNPLRNEGI